MNIPNGAKKQKTRGLLSRKPVIQALREHVSYK